MYENNGFANCYEELKTFYPIFYLDVFEMKAILSAHGKLIDDTIANINLVVDNNFVENADEATITKLEKFLWLETDKTRPLEERKRLVFSFFVGFGKISASKIADMIRSFTDTESTITFEPGDAAGNNYLTIMIERGTVEKLFFADIATVLYKKLPAHISYKAVVRYVFPTVVANKKTNYVNNHKLCGISPEPALLAALRSQYTETREYHENIKSSYAAADETKLSGLEPTPAFLANLLYNAAVTQAVTDSHAINYPLSGETPEQALVGENANINAGTAVKTTAVPVGYIPCGTKSTKA
ncbi:MAG: hypothetical protein RR162_00325 [Oscillospiraceae bacterium]